MKPGNKQSELRGYYTVLHKTWGPQHWWPARTRFEVIIGAYLTQNTSWTNVESAMRKLRQAGVLTLAGIRKISLSKLETLVRSSGYFRQKASRLKLFVTFVDRRYGGSLAKMFSQPTARLRQELLELNGVGPETADAILLYAGQHPVFVVDTYTRRILERHEIISADARYEEIRELFEQALSAPEDTWKQESGAAPEFFDPARQTFGRDVPAYAAHLPSTMSRRRRSSLAQIYNDMHGLIVNVGKNYCLKSRALCESCPLQVFLPNGRVKI